jgi:ABC-type phosphate/phosphonate transport system ATPase subunit
MKRYSHSWKILLNCPTKQECYQLASIPYRVNFQEMVLQRASQSHEGRSQFIEIIQTKNRRPSLHNRGLISDIMSVQRLCYL